MNTQEMLKKSLHSRNEMEEKEEKEEKKEKKEKEEKEERAKNSRLIGVVPPYFGKKDLLESLPYFLRRKILGFLYLKEYSLASISCKYLRKALKKSFQNKNMSLVVPEDCSTIDEALKVVGPFFIYCEKDDEKLSVGTSIFARYKHRGAYYPGKIESIEHGRYNIAFDDGDDRQATPANDIKILVDSPSAMSLQKSVNTIILNEGEHHVLKDNIGTTFCYINRSINIIGHPKVHKTKIRIIGGITISEKCQGNVHIENVTVHHLKGSGITGRSNFSLEDVLIERCCTEGYGAGILATGSSAVGRCTNIEIKNCGGVGIHSTFGASVTLVGSKTKIHHNCQHTGSSIMSAGGISLSGSASSSVLLVSPLTRESVSFDNRSDHNWYAFSGSDLSNFKTIEEGEI